VLSDLDNKDINPELLAENVIENPRAINQLLDGLLSKNETLRYNCFKILYRISEKKPDILYPHWDFFINHLRSNNQYHKMSAVIILANLTAIDAKNRFESIFDEYYSTLKSKKTVTPIYIVKSSGKIVNNKPNLEDKITKILLNIESIHPGKQIELVKCAVIESFSEFFTKAKNKDEIISFVEKQVSSESPKTRKTAKEFLNKFVEK
jgi:transcription termination factor NusB